VAEDIAARARLKKRDEGAIGFSPGRAGPPTYAVAVFRIGGDRAVSAVSVGTPKFVLGPGRDWTTGAKGTGQSIMPVQLIPLPGDCTGPKATRAGWEKRDARGIEF